MKKCIIYYFSGTGNTFKAAKSYQKAFEEKDVAVTLRRVDSKLDAYDVEQYDYFGVGYPIHGFNAPQIVLDFAKMLPTVKNKSMFIFKTSGEPIALNNASSLKFVKILSKKGYVLTNEYHYVMPYNIIFRHDDGMAALMYQTMCNLIPLDVNEILSKNKSLLKPVVLGKFLAWVFRIEHFAMKVNGRFFNVDMKKCTLCGLCEKNCPTANIEIVQKEKFSFGKNCVACMSCSFACPENAIKIGILNSWKVNGRYNFAATPKRQEGKHAKYCKRAYDKYFEKANKKL